MVWEWRNEGGTGWRLDDINDIVTTEEREAILMIRCSDYGSPDFLAWNHTKNGEFSVRSAYHLEMERRSGNIGGSNGDSLKHMWKNIWEAKVPQKVKHLVWWAVLNGLPTKGKLNDRGMKIDHQCPRCGEEKETMEHVLLTCRDSRLVWCVSPARIDSTQEEVAMDAWCQGWVMKCKEPRTWSLIMMILWQIWNARNAWIFEGWKMAPHIICEKALKLLNEFEGALLREDFQQPSAHESTRHWTKPHKAPVKLNADAAIREGCCGLGVVVRDEVGDVLMAAGESLSGGVVSSRGGSPSHSFRHEDCV